MSEPKTEEDLLSWLNYNLPKVPDEDRRGIIRCRDDGQLYSAVMGISLAVNTEDVEFPDFQIDEFIKIAGDLEWTSEHIREVERGLSHGRRGDAPRDQ